MTQEKYDAFVAQLQQWREQNAEDYDDFEDMMNSVSGEGYNAICKRAVRLMPSFQRLVRSKIKEYGEVEISDIVELAEREGLVGKILCELKKSKTQSFVPAMLCWLYFGRSFEGMVEHGESILRLPTTSWFEKLYVNFGIRMIVWQSQKLGLRTADDWQKYRSLRAIISSGKSLDYAIDNLATCSTSASAGNSSSINAKMPFTSMLAVVDTHRQKLRVKLQHYIGPGAKGKSIAFMIIALRELYYLPSPPL